MTRDVRDPRLLDHDVASGITEYFHYDDDGGFTIEYQQDVTALIELNKALWNNKDKHSRYGELDRVASVPNVVLMDLAKQRMVSPTGVILDEKKYAAWLNDPANLAFRTRPGKI